MLWVPHNLYVNPCLRRRGAPHDSVMRRGGGRSERLLELEDHHARGGRGAAKKLAQPACKPDA